LCDQDQCGAALGRAGKHLKGAAPISGIILHGFAAFAYVMS
jgi:hypothetical protein